MSEASKKTTSKPDGKSSEKVSEPVVKSSPLEASKTKQNEAVGPTTNEVLGKVTEGSENNATPDQAIRTASNDATGDGTGDIGSPSAKGSVNDVADMGIAGDRDTSEKTEMDEPYIKGALEVVSNSDAGFWRCGAKFERLEKTLVLAVETDQKTTGTLAFMGYEPHRIVYMSPEKTQKVFNEVNLTIIPVDLDNLIVKESE